MKNPNLARFDIDEIQLGRKLGSGGFSHVHEVLSFHPKKEGASSFENGNDTSSKHDGRKACTFLARCAAHYKATGCQAPFAIKFIKESLMDGKKKIFDVATRDLKNEAVLLSCIDHPNILKIRGLSSSTAKNEKGFFIIVDRLDQTLPEKIHLWKCQLHFAKQGASSPYLKAKAMGACKRIYLEQLKIALDIASALEYLHEEKGIVYRDLKPDNVGLNIRGETKIFDFGLARRLPHKMKKKTRPFNHVFDKEQENDDVDEGGLNMSGRVGTPRYMAPEVWRSKSYDTRADVHSFALLLWEILALQQPYSKISKSTFINEVMQGNYRPPLDEKWPQEIQDMLRNAWHPDMSRRPTMREIRLKLEAQIIQAIIDKNMITKEESLESPRTTGRILGRRSRTPPPSRATFIEPTINIKDKEKKNENMTKKKNSNKTNKTFASATRTTIEAILSPTSSKKIAFRAA